MKRRVPLGVIRTPAGPVVIKNATVARTLDNLLAERTMRLAALQNHWWVRLGEVLRILKP